MKYLIFFLLITTSVLSKDVFIRDSIEFRDLYLKTYPTLFGKSNVALPSDFKETYEEQNKKTKKKIRHLISLLDKDLPAEFIRPLVYWKYIEPEQSKLKEVLTYIQLYKLLILRDYIQNPRSKNSLAALNILRELMEEPELNSQTFFDTAYPYLDHKSDFLSKMSDENTFLKALSETKLIFFNPAEKIKDLKPFVLDPYGIIHGNKVELLSHNETGIERIQWVNERSIFNGGELDFSEPYMRIENHPVFKDEIFKRMKEMISRAKESTFIDIFLFGGTMGGAFAKFAIDEALKKEEGYKLLILHDYATNYNMKDEMMPIFEYIKNRIENEPDVQKRVFLLQANIQRHPPGIPFNLTGLIPKTDEVFKEVEKRNTYYESKIDHSKVIVIDANTEAPEAYFGSKNWSDHSGSYYYDNAIWIKGPAAALVQDSYIEDLEAALTEDEKEMSWFFYKELGFDNKSYLPLKKELLEFFRIKRDSYPSQGNSAVRIAEASVDGRIRNVRNTLIDLIRDAKDNIYMEQLFLYDPYVVDALILKKKNNPSIDIKVLIDNNENFGFNGFPNTMFVKKMKDAGIKIRARKLHGATAYFKNGMTQEYHQENHRKISSFDGEIMLVGSSNINPDTLQGSFREIGAVVYDKVETAKFENYFEKDWSDKEKINKVNIEDWQMKVGESYLSKIWSAIINDLAATLLRSKDKIERRY